MTSPPLGWLTYDLHRQLSSLMTHGELPPEFVKHYEDWWGPRPSLSEEEGT